MRIMGVDAWVAMQQQQLVVGLYYGRPAVTPSLSPALETFPQYSSAA
jgi:hypothetical protein